MRRLSAEHVVYELSKDHPPAYTVADGETVIVETRDAGDGFLGRDGVWKPGRGRPNPSTGPIAVEGSEPGEALAVTIHEIRVADWGYIGGGEGVKPTIVELRDGIAHYPWGLRLPVRPLMGVMGVAPPGEPVGLMSLTDWGGNFDSPDISAGATIHFPVAAPGAMLVTGDAHARQGDGECCGTGIECAVEVVLTVRRVRDPVWHKVYLVRDDELTVYGTSADLDEAAWNAVGDMTELLTKLTGLSEVESRRLLATAGDVRISQIVCPEKTCRAVIPRRAIPDRWPFQS